MSHHVLKVVAVPFSTTLFKEIFINQLSSSVEYRTQCVGLHFFCIRFRLLNAKHALIIKAKLAAQIGVDVGRRKRYMLLLLYLIIFSFDFKPFYQISRLLHWLRSIVR